MWLQKGNLKRETEFLLIATQTNVMRTNYIKAKINNVQQNKKCRLCGDKDKIINHMISKCSKLAQKEYNIRYDRVETVIHGEWHKKMKFDYITKRYMYKQESIPENGTHKILCNFEIQTDNLIPTRRPDWEIINKKKRTCSIVDFAIAAEWKSKKLKRETST